MNAKSKVFGLLAAIALSMSMFAGAAADDVQPVSVSLTGDFYICAIDVYVWSGTFGDWVYDANSDSYVNTAYTSTTNFWAWVDTTNPAGCNIAMAFGGLSNGGHLIGTENFSAVDRWWSNGTVYNPAGWYNTGVGTGWYDFDMTLNQVPLVPAGVYTGNITATISNTV